MRGKFKNRKTNASTMDISGRLGRGKGLSREMQDAITILDSIRDKKPITVVLNYVAPPVDLIAKLSMKYGFFATIDEANIWIAQNVKFQRL